MKKYFIRSMVFTAMIFIGSYDIRSMEFPQSSHGKKSSQEREWSPFDQLTPEEKEKYRTVSSFLNEAMNKIDDYWFEIKDDMNWMLSFLEYVFRNAGNLIPNQRNIDSLRQGWPLSEMKKKQGMHMDFIHSMIYPKSLLEDRICDFNVDKIFNVLSSVIKSLNSKLYNTRELPEDYFKENIENQKERFKKIKEILDFEEFLKKYREEQTSEIASGLSNEEKIGLQFLITTDPMFFPQDAGGNDAIKSRIDQLLKSTANKLAHWKSAQEYIDNFSKSLRGTAEMMKILVDLDEKKHTDPI